MDKDARQELISRMVRARRKKPGRPAQQNNTSTTTQPMKTISTTGAKPEPRQEPPAEVSAWQPIEPMTRHGVGTPARLGKNAITFSEEALTEIGVKPPCRVVIEHNGLRMRIRTAAEGERGYTLYATYKGSRKYAVKSKAMNAAFHRAMIEWKLIDGIFEPVKSEYLSK